ncbi:MAG: protein kinase [Chroococcidiopsidaceae cyanobacterium CP_BM_ER_R8_30]|nr:protein kinase [Chroococcidiopsidaceae cyanobacterium CP_BM_ER_R8_30]
MLLYCSQGHQNPPNSRFCGECGQQLPLAIGQTIENRYRIVRQLGQGGFGRTFLAEEINRANQSCVLKAFTPQDRQPEQLRKAKELFEREARILYQLKHPQIPAFRELLQANLSGQSFLFLVQDYVEGETYSQLLGARKSQGASFAEVEVCQLLLQILPVLSYIHSLNVVHRDISPDNLILRSCDHKPVLIDFGGVKQLTTAPMFWFNQIGIERTRLGKQGYAPEEQMQQGEASPSSDLYALAVTALVLLTGKEPQELYDSDKKIWLWGREIHVSPRLEAVLKKMLAYKPEARYQKAEAVFQELQLPNPSPLNFNLSQIRTISLSIPKALSSGHQHSPSPSHESQTSGTQRFAGGGSGDCVEQAQGSAGGGSGSTLSQSQRSIGGNSLARRAQAQVLVPSTARKGWLHGRVLRVAGAGLALALGINAWTLVNTVIHSIHLVPLSSSAEKQLTAQLLHRRQAMAIKPSFFNAIVDAQFYNEHPKLRGRSLKKAPKDANLRQQWEENAQDLLNRIEQAQLSSAARGKLGSYSYQDYENWKEKANQGQLDGLTMDQLEKQVDEKFAHSFPKQQGEKLNLETFGQIWYAIFSDEVNQSTKHNIQ